MRKLKTACTAREFDVNDFAFVSMPASGWTAADAQPWRRPGPVAIGAEFVARVPLA
jgi:hypothetical protein